MGFQNISGIKKIFAVLTVALYYAVHTSPVVAQTSLYQDEMFAYEVKQIDEFFERFNDQKTLIKDYLAKHQDVGEVNRDILIKSLFNLRSNSIRGADVYKFIEVVNNEQQPVVLNFYDKDWYAQVKCTVLYQQKKRDLWLVMRVQQEDNGTSKWVISGVSADFLTTPNVVDSTVSLNPVSHGTDFLGLSRAFEDNQNLKSYLPSDFKEDQLSMLVHELKHKRVSFLHVEEIFYHFLQIDGWILTVENFQRPEKNSGWLISKLIQADLKAKENYKQSVLKLKI